MEPRDWLLLYVAFKGAPHGLDPVRIQKGMFLFAQEGGVSKTEGYEFEPLHYGPMSKQVYADVDRLVADGLIRGEAVPGYTWKRYTITPAGMDVAKHLYEDADELPMQRLYAIKQDVSTKSFNALLRDVYARYPPYAVKSVFSG